MPTCLHCNAQVSDAAVYCGNCGAAINSPATSVSTSQNQVTLQGSHASSNTPADGDLYMRLEKAMRRTELLSYAAAGLGLAMLFAIIGVAFV
jgi:predicted amidophosphoribosyltransferase